MPSIGVGGRVFLCPRGESGIILMIHSISSGDWGGLPMTSWRPAYPGFSAPLTPLAGDSREPSFLFFPFVPVAPGPRRRVLPTSPVVVPGAASPSASAACCHRRSVVTYSRRLTRASRSSSRGSEGLSLPSVPSSLVRSLTSSASSRPWALLPCQDHVRPPRPWVDLPGRKVS